MNARLSYTNIGPRLVVHKPLIALVSAEYLVSLSHRQRLTCVYKRMFKLRFLISDSQIQLDQYCNLLRRKFQKLPFDVRRNALLDVNENLSEQAMAKRLANTLAFVFNASCESDGTIPLVDFYDDLKQALRKRPEANILHTMLRMEYETPNIIKYDYSYGWVEGVKEFYKIADSKISSKDYNKLAGTKMAHYVGFLHYERSIAHLNETLALCL